MIRATPLLVVLMAACASSLGEAPPGASSAVNLRADPPGLGFDCIAPGCTQERRTRLVSEGPAPVRVFTLELETATSNDFQVMTAQVTPFDLAPGQAADVVLRYAPADAAPDSGALVVAYGTPEATERLTMRIPLLTQAFGAPKIEFSPELLSFGFIPVGQRGTLDVTIRNVGTGNALLEVPSAAIQAGSVFSVSPAVPPALVLAPREEKKLTVAYEPTAEAVHFDRLLLITNDPARESAEVLLRGTSIQGGRASLDPAGPFALGDVRVGSSLDQALRLYNFGGAPLEVQNLVLGGPGATYFRVNPPLGAFEPLAPFGSTSLTVTYEPTDVGEHEATLTIGTSDVSQPELAVAFGARGVDPRLVVEPATVDFGQVVLGWRRGPTGITARNDGYGPVKIERVFFAPGSSAEFELGTLPALPIVLEAGESTVFEVSYSVGTLSSVAGRLVLEGDDPREPRQEVAISGEGVSCEVGCAMAHATPRCDSGQCEVASCESGYFDTDASAASGCECRIESPEPSSFCAEAIFLGSLVDDDGDSRWVTGQLHHAGDVDWYNFFGVDSGGINELFGDDYDVRITLSGPPGYRMCVFRTKRGAHEDVCPSGVDQPCTGTTYYRDDGSYGSGDDADYFIKVFSAEPQVSCQPYTIYIKNG